jgi:hypothetical protein
MTLVTGLQKTGRQRVTQDKSVPAPVAGWVTAQNIAASQQGTCLVLDNWFPTTTGIRLRGGNVKRATLGDDPVESFIGYFGAAQRRFAASGGNIYDFTSIIDPNVPPTPIVTGQASNYYAYVNFSTTGGDFVYAVNGTDPALLFDGTAFYQITDSDIRTLSYDNGTGAFSVGLVVTGGTSSATGTVIRVDGTTASGTLYLKNVTGTFQNNETLTDADTGDAQANGVDALFVSGITGANTSSFTHVNVYRNRLYFVSNVENSIFYLPVDSIGGAAGALSLSGIFRKGGRPYFTATWSSESGSASLNDYLVVVSTEGEAAIFQGSFPGDPQWTLVAVVEISRPLGINGWMKAGGDIVVATERGMIPISAARVKDPAALALDAVSRLIEPTWRAEVAARRTFPWEVAKWDDKSAFLVNAPVTTAINNRITLVGNLQTGAWCRYTGWDNRCFLVSDGQLYFGCNDGTIRQAEISGYDVDQPYNCQVAFAWDHMGNPAYRKSIKQAKAEFLTDIPFNIRLSASTDYMQEFPIPPNVMPSTETPSLWDVGKWDVAQWDDGAVPVRRTTRWRSVSRTGEIFSFQVQVPMGNDRAPNAELTIVHLIFEGGGIG